MCWKYKACVFCRICKCSLRNKPRILNPVSKSQFHKITIPVPEHCVMQRSFYALPKLIINQSHLKCLGISILDNRIWSQIDKWKMARLFVNTPRATSCVMNSGFTPVVSLIVALDDLSVRALPFLDFCINLGQCMSRTVTVSDNW